MASYDLSANATVSDLLDFGSRMLLYFEKFEPRYLRYKGRLPSVGSRPVDYKSLHARYYEQNGLKEDNFDRTADALREVLDSTRVQHGSQERTTQAVAGAWQGQAATSALDMLRGQLRISATDITALQQIWEAFDKAPNALREAVRIKADKVLYILEDGLDVEIDDKSPDDVDAIISGADGIGASAFFWSNSEVNKIEKLFPDLQEGWRDGLSRFGDTVLGGVVFSGSPYENALQSRCEDWLDNVFEPDYVAKLERFIEACDKTDLAVKAVYTKITDSMKTLSEEGYPQPQGTSKTDTETAGTGNGTTGTGNGTTATGNGTTGTGNGTTGTGNGTTGTGNGTTATGTGNGKTATGTGNGTTAVTIPSTSTTVPSTTTPTTTTTSSGTNALSGLASLSQLASTLGSTASTLGQSLGTGLSSLGAMITSGVDDALEKLEEQVTKDENKDENKDEAKKDGTSLAEFDVAGKHLKLEIGADGQPKLLSTDADGTTHAYAVKLDENGNPTITDDEQKKDGEKNGNEKNGNEKNGEEKNGSGDSGSGAAPNQPSRQPGADASPTETPGNSGATPGVPSTGKREEDGEHTPQPIPNSSVSDNAEEPVGSGAQLAEAGPL